eukprot:10905870-Heterocapsa_arctica.AAC.1
MNRTRKHNLNTCRGGESPIKKKGYIEPENCDGTHPQTTYTDGKKVEPYKEATGRTRMTYSHGNDNKEADEKTGCGKQYWQTYCCGKRYNEFIRIISAQITDRSLGPKQENSHVSDHSTEGDEL